MSRMVNLPVRGGTSTFCEGSPGLTDTHKKIHTNSTARKRERITCN